MSTITIECPECHKEHTVKFRGDEFLAGGILCECGAQYRFTFYRTTHVFKPMQPGQKGVFTNE